MSGDQSGLTQPPMSDPNFNPQVTSGQVNSNVQMNGHAPPGQQFDEFGSAMNNDMVSIICNSHFL